MAEARKVGDEWNSRIMVGEKAVLDNRLRCADGRVFPRSNCLFEPIAWERRLQVGQSRVYVLTIKVDSADVEPTGCKSEAALKNGKAALSPPIKAAGVSRTFENGPSD